MKKKQLKLCKTVGSLIKELDKLPKSAKLARELRPVHYNTGDAAKKLELKPCVDFEEY